LPGVKVPAVVAAKPLFVYGDARWSAKFSSGDLPVTMACNSTDMHISILTTTLLLPY
jgi:hypothetical protein